MREGPGAWVKMLSIGAEQRCVNVGVGAGVFRDRCVGVGAQVKNAQLLVRMLRYGCTGVGVQAICLYPC